MTVAALAIPFGGVALANHGAANEGTHDLQVIPETDENPTGAGHTLTATVSGGAGSEVDFEVESGPAIRANCTPGADGAPCPGGTANNDGSSPTTPDLTCTTDATGTCSVFFTSDTAGTNIIRAWVDDDTDNATFDADQTEGRDEATTPGSRTEVDDTDVVSKTWFSAAAANVRLDCTDDDTTDTETNPAGQPETYTCRAYNTQGTPGAGDDTVVANQQIDAEVAGANDPDNRGFADPLNNTVDFNNACTTDANGTCTFTLTPSENEVGTANLCFFIDEDNDAEFANGNQANRSFDGGNCNAEGATQDEPDTNKTDVVQKTWQQAGQPATLDATPERASNVKGTNHTVTATVLDTFGNPAPNVLVDFVVTGANAGDGCQNVATNAQGVATCTYQDDTTVVGPEPEVDTIDVFVDNSGDTDTTVDEVDVDLADRVEKFWYTTVPTAGAVIVDMRPDQDTSTNANFCDDAADSTATNPVNTNHDFCGVVRDANGTAIAGKNVTLTITGPGNFVNEGSTGGNTGADRDDDVSLGKTTTVTTDANGRYQATITSTETGTTTVTATADQVSDTGTKVWQGAPARVINCEPETATNAPGTDHQIICTVTDRFGNPVQFQEISVEEAGPGRIVNGSESFGCYTNTDRCFYTDAQGQISIIVASSAAESGTQTVTAQIGCLTNAQGGNVTCNTNDVGDADDANDLDNPCDQAAGNLSTAEGDNSNTDQDNQTTGAPAGACEDPVQKVWAEDTGPQPECADEVDNDNDGRIDFPADPGCESAADDSESDFPDQSFGGETGQPVTSGACAGFTTGSVQQNSTGTGLVIVGTNGPDALEGSTGDDLICALDGDDAVVALAGNDVVYGGGGADAIEGGDGNDQLFGGGGKDEIDGAGGNDELFGGQSHDILQGGGGDDVLRGQNGWDTLKGEGGNDLLIGADGRDILQGGSGNDVANGGALDDVLKGYIGNDVLRGGGGDDIIKGFRGRDRLFGGAGADFLHGGPGRDFCRGGRGRDIFRSCNP